MHSVQLTIQNIADQEHLNRIIDLINDEAYVSDVEVL